MWRKYMVGCHQHEWSNREKYMGALVFWCLKLKTYMFVVNRFGHERHCQHDDAGDDKQNQPKVKVVNSTYDSGTVTGDSTATCPINKLSNHPAQAHTQPNYEAIKCTLWKERKKDKYYFISKYF